MSHYEGDVQSPGSARYAIIASRWNPRITDALVDSARKAFLEYGVPAEALDVIRVPGAWELPIAAASAIDRIGYTGIVALGCVIRGDTRHFEQVADECARGLMRVSLDTGVPIANGVLAVDDYAHAESRAGGSHGNKGQEAALVIIEMANLIGKLA
ncbi:6,7-dimethyl-8-ribityllumazine synthase [Arenimonas sp. MALMAid1274]|uniref:6,7-dimethyl-8-ribityllumazine synthase n=1 Tax=Arenimonas sp. MALMAid1274 TaxID=3411630 RepID=UPI003BA17C8F